MQFKEKAEFHSQNPATGEIVWKGQETSEKEAIEIISQAQKAFETWSSFGIEKRIECLFAFESSLKENQTLLAETISQETGKPLWESKGEVISMMKKVSISVEAEKERCKKIEIRSDHTSFTLHHKPIGVVAVFGPFNFPGHLPNGHIVPALLAGNTVIYKGSEKTPLVSEKIAALWNKILPKGVLNLIQGGAKVGKFLLENPAIDGFFFTGSYNTGRAILEKVGGDCEKVVALEMGGNNPLVIHDVSDLKAAALAIIQSAFLTSGQRCSCARRLIVVETKENEKLLSTLCQLMKTIKVGAYTEKPEPFMGPVISMDAARSLLKAQENLINLGAIPLIKMTSLKENTPLLSPGLIDITPVKTVPDEEYFGPLLQVIRVKDLNEAIEKANETEYGLTASFFSKDEEKFRRFFNRVKAGVINWNQPTTGANSSMPFGGVKKSGNHRPSAYYAADYCAYPVASSQSSAVLLPKETLPGVTIE